MNYKNLEATALACIGIFLFNSAAKAQNIPTHIEIEEHYSLGPDKTLYLQAYESIVIREGFKMAPGSSLTLVVVPRNDMSLQHDIEPNALYPNPGKERITLSVFYRNMTVTVWDDSGNLVLKSIVNGTDPVLDISGLRNGKYILKTREVDTRFIKE